MIEWLQNAANWWTTGILGLILYYLPLTLCAYGYTVRTYKTYRRDIESRESRSVYTPELKVGTIIGYGLVTIIPIANLCAAVFDIAPEVFHDFFEWLGKVFDMPLVPDSEYYKTKRESDNE